jgi:hypothetical protein
MNLNIENFSSQLSKENNFKIKPCLDLRDNWNAGY